MAHHSCICGVTISANKTKCSVCAETGGPVLTSEQKLSFTVKVVTDAMLAGEAPYISCPYCSKEYRLEEDEPMCCMLFAAAVEAALLHIDTAQQIDTVKRIADKI